MLSVRGPNQDPDREDILRDVIGPAVRGVASGSTDGVSAVTAAIRGLPINRVRALLSTAISYTSSSAMVFEPSGEAREPMDPRIAVALARSLVELHAPSSRDVAALVSVVVEHAGGDYDTAVDATLAVVLAVPGMPAQPATHIGTLAFRVGWSSLPRSDALAHVVARSGLPDRWVCDDTTMVSGIRDGFAAIGHDPIGRLAGWLLFPDALPHPGTPTPEAVAWGTAQASADAPWTMRLLAWMGTVP